MHPHYSKLGIEYQQAYSGPYMDLCSDGNVVAEKDGILTGFGRPVCITEDDSFLRMLTEYGARLWYVDKSSNISKITRWLLSTGHEPRPVYFHEIDLTVPRKIRKSYRNLINQNTATISHDPDDLDRLKKLHFECSGRKTRPDKTWDIQKKMIQEGQGFMSYSEFSAAFFTVYDDICYYGVSATTRGVGHGVVNEAIEHAIRLGLRTFDYGQIYFSEDKNGKISKFKMGFGGTTRVGLEFKYEV